MHAGSLRSTIASPAAQLASSFLNLETVLASIAVSLTIAAVALPWVLLLLAPLGALYCYVQQLVSEPAGGTAHRVWHAGCEVWEMGGWAGRRGVQAR